MQHILILGAGRSSLFLIEYLMKCADELGWQVRIGDARPEEAARMLKEQWAESIFHLDASNTEARRREIEKCDLVVSMLPAHMHPGVAQDCLELKKHLVTPSYVSKELRQMEDKVKEAGLIFMNELGLDPGIDHMSALQLLRRLTSKGEEVSCFESFTGGLVAPESDDNPWHYKFTWNPRNVVLAGQGGAVKFKHNGRYKYIPYQKLFRRTEIIEIPEYGRFEGYANRDSLNYRKLYGLEHVPTIYRGTLRRVGFCRAWDIFVQLGLTDDSYIMEDSADMTHRQFVNSFLAYNPHDSVELKLMHYMKLDQDSDLIEKLHWLDIFSDEPVGLGEDASPARILQHILEKKWSLKPEDKDMIVMWHKVCTRSKGEGHEREFHSSMVVIGESEPRTAMAKTVGLPVAIAVRLIMEGTYAKPGVHIPVDPDLYEPILAELKTMGIRFEEREVQPQES